jgi:hypothetical protein
LPLLFQCHWACCDDDITVVEGLTSYPDADIEVNLLEKQSIVFGYDECGLIGNFVIKDGDPGDVENVIGFEVQAKFQLSSIVAPSCPFVQLRLSDVLDGKLVLGETFFTLEGADITAQILSGGGLEMIAFKSIMGFLPGMAPEEK